MSETTASRHSGMFWIGWILTLLPALMLLFDAYGKFAKPPQVVEMTTKLGYPESVLTPLGIILLVCTLLYFLPPTAVLGAILLTGYLGGAVASHVRHQDPLFSHVLVPVYVGIIIWLGIWFRDVRLRRLVPFRM